MNGARLETAGSASAGAPSSDQSAHQQPPVAEPRRQARRGELGSDRRRTSGRRSTGPAAESADAQRSVEYRGTDREQQVEAGHRAEVGDRTGGRSGRSAAVGASGRWRLSSQVAVIVAEWSCARPSCGMWSPVRSSSVAIQWTGLSPELLVPLDRDLDEPLRIQLESGLREAIRTGRLRAGERLPSTRELARALGVSRGLVVDCFDQLQAEGYLASTAALRHPRCARPPAASPAVPRRAQPAPRARWTWTSCQPCPI